MQAIEIVGKYTDYEYDYDNCYNFDWEKPNDCLEVGERYNIAIRNSYFTIGRNYNNVEYFTKMYPMKETLSTWI